MRVFLTGATGYIGGAIAEKLQEYGHEVLGLARSESSAAKLRERGYSAHPGDLSDLPSLAQGAREADGVIHAAATDGHTHYAALSAILPAISGTGKPLVYTSGSLIYGETGPDPIDEDTPVSGEHVHFHVIDEALIFDEKWGVRPTAIRVPLAFGRGGGNLQLQLIEMARQLGKAAYVAPGENRWSTVYVRDLADVYVRALERAPAGSIFNPASGSVSMAEWAEAISHAIGRPGETVAWSPVEAMRYVGSFAQTWQLNQMLDGSRAREVLGWRPEGPKAFDEFAYGSYAQQSAVR